MMCGSPRIRPRCLGPAVRCSSAKPGFHWWGCRHVRWGGTCGSKAACVRCHRAHRLPRQRCNCAPRGWPRPKACARPGSWACCPSWRTRPRAARRMRSPWLCGGGCRSCRSAAASRAWRWRCLRPWANRPRAACPWGSRTSSRARRWRPWPCLPTPSMSSVQRICIWDLTGSGRVQMLVGHQSTVYGLVGLEGNRLASFAEDGCLRIWNLDDLSCTQELNDHQKLTYALTITPDHRYLVSGSDDCTIRLWEIANGFISTVLVGHTDFVNTFAFLNKDTLLSGSDDKTIKVWDLRTRRCVQTLPINTNWIWSLTTLLNGEILSVDTKGFITHWKKVTKDLSFRSYLKEKCHISVSENIIYLKQSSEDQFNSEASFLFSDAKNFIAFIVAQDEGLRNISVHSLGRDIVSYTCSMVDQTKLLLELFYALQNVNVEAFQKSQISYSTNRYMLSSIRDRNTAGQGENGRSEFYGSRPQASSSSSY